MLSKSGYLNDRARNWHPHLMFFVPLATSKSWGADLNGSPVLASDDASDRLTIFMIPVARWWGAEQPRVGAGTRARIRLG
ncbi:MAG: hypothetical protein ACRD1E_02980 [Terriglobales bacterium]